MGCEKSRPVIFTTPCCLGQGYETSLSVLRPVPHPKSRTERFAELFVEVIQARKVGRRVCSSKSSIAWSMLPSVS
jgi:hypothetical protein